MKNCHVCNQLCDDNAELCPICGADISGDGKVVAEVTKEEEKIEPVLLTTFEDLVSAEIFKDVLTDNKIPYSDSEDAMKVVFGGGFSAEEIYVDKTDFDKARELLEEFLASSVSFDEEFDGEIEDI